MRALKYIGIGLVSLIVLLIAYGVAIEPYLLDVEQYEVALPDLPPAWDGQRVGVIADLQVGMWMDNTSTMERAVDVLVDEDPAVALIAGDFIYRAGTDWQEEIETAVEIVRPLPEAGIPTYAVLGNHDYGVGGMDEPVNEEQAQALEEALEAVGIPVLENEARPLDLIDDESPLYLVGIGSRLARRAHPEVALADVPADAPRLLMHHHPDTFEELPADTAPLAVAGHTHGGQIALPFTPHWTWLTYARSDEVHADGWIEDTYGAPGNRLYINRGIGFSLVPMRISARPEVTFFILRPAEPVQALRSP